MRYYVLHNKHQYGPFDETEIRELLTAGILTFNDLVAPEGTLKFQSLAKTDLIFATPGDRASLYPFPANPQAETAHKETAAASSMGTAFTYPSLSTEITPAEKAEINPKKNTNRFTWRQTIIGQSAECFFSHIYDWLLILAITMTVQGFLFSKTFSAIFRLLFPAPEDPIGVSFTGQVVEMAVVALIGLYISSMAILITILGAASRDSHRFFNYKLLFRKAHRKLPVFWVTAVNFASIYVTVILSAVLLPDRFAIFGKYAAKVIFIPVAYRLFAVPFVIILENIGLIEAYRISCRLLKKHFKPIFCACLVYIGLHTAIRFSVSKWPFGIALTHLLQLVTLIFATRYYKHLSSTALIQRKRVE